MAAERRGTDGNNHELTADLESLVESCDLVIAGVTPPTVNCPAYSFSTPAGVVLGRTVGLSHAVTWLRGPPSGQGDVALMLGLVRQGIPLPKAMDLRLEGIVRAAWPRFLWQ